MPPGTAVRDCCNCAVGVTVTEGIVCSFGVPGGCYCTTVSGGGPPMFAASDWCHAAWPYGVPQSALQHCVEGGGGNTR
jgi:hypothetical protein